jgi:hypothetical protein
MSSKSKHSKITSADEPALFLLNEDVFNVILQFLDKECAQSLHTTCRLTHHWVKNLIPWMFKHIDRFPELRNEGVLNKQILYHMPLREFIRTIRPKLLEYPEILNGYQTAFEDKARKAFDHDRDYETYAVSRNTQLVYEQKALALKYPSLTEDEVYEINELLHDSISVDLPHFLKDLRQVFLKNTTLKATYIEKLTNEIDRNFQIMQHNPTQEEYDEIYVPLLEKNTLNRQQIYALENPLATEAEIIAINN